MASFISHSTHTTATPPLPFNCSPIPSHLMASSSVANRSYLDQRLAVAKRCSHEGVIAGTKAAVMATVASAIPTLASVRMLPWARANLNPTAQALMVSTAAGMAYFIVADRTILATARRNSFGRLPDSHVSA